VGFETSSIQINVIENKEIANMTFFKDFSKPGNEEAESFKLNYFLFFYWIWKLCCLIVAWKEWKHERWKVVLKLRFSFTFNILESGVLIVVFYGCIWIQGGSNLPKTSKIKYFFPLKMAKLIENIKYLFLKIYN